MQWSKLKAQYETFLAPSLQHRLDVFVTGYRRSHDWGRGWFCFDGTQVLTLDTVPFDIRFGSCGCRRSAPGWQGRASNYRPGPYLRSLGDSIYELVTDPIDRSLSSTADLTRALALLDRRIGRRRLAELEPEQLSEVEAFTLGLRQFADGRSRTVPECPACARPVLDGGRERRAEGGDRVP